MLACCFSRLTIDHASLSRRATCLLPIDTSSTTALNTLLYITHKPVIYSVPFLIRGLYPPTTSYLAVVCSLLSHVPNDFMPLSSASDLTRGGCTHDHACNSHQTIDLTSLQSRDGACLIYCLMGVSPFQQYVVRSFLLSGVEVLPRRTT